MHAFGSNHSHSTRPQHDFRRTVLDSGARVAPTQEVLSSTCTVDNVSVHARDWHCKGHRMWVEASARNHQVDPFLIVNTAAQFEMEDVFAIVVSNSCMGVCALRNLSMVSRTLYLASIYELRKLKDSCIILVWAIQRHYLPLARRRSMTCYGAQNLLPARYNGETRVRVYKMTSEYTRTHVGLRWSSVDMELAGAGITSIVIVTPTPMRFYVRAEGCGMDFVHTKRPGQSQALFPREHLDHDPILSSTHLEWLSMFTARKTAYLVVTYRDMSPAPKETRIMFDNCRLYYYCMPRMVYVP